MDKSNSPIHELNKNEEHFYVCLSYFPSSTEVSSLKTSTHDVGSPSASNAAWKPWRCSYLCPRWLQETPTAAGKNTFSERICCWTCKTLTCWCVFLMIFVGLFQRCFFAFWWFSWVTLVDQKVRNTTCSGVSILRQRSRVRVKKSEAILPLVDQEQTTMTWEYWSNIDVAEPRASWCGTCFWVLLWFTILWTPYEMGYCRQMCLKIINQQDQH